MYVLPPANWSVFILSAAADGSFAEQVVTGLQKLYPNAAIFGGITSRHLGIGKGSCFYPADPRTARSVAVLALRGNVPIHCVVSRGMESLSAVYSVLPTQNISSTGDRFSIISSLVEEDGRRHFPIEVIKSFSSILESHQVGCYIPYSQMNVLDMYVCV